MDWRPAGKNENVDPATGKRGIRMVPIFRPTWRGIRNAETINKGKSPEPTEEREPPTALALMGKNAWELDAEERREFLRKVKELERS